MTVPAKQNMVTPEVMESVLARGDLSKLTEQQRTEYYVKLCSSLGLNPLTQPFEYLTLNNKLVLYAKRACADQLRKINGISLTVVSQDQSDGILTVHVRAKDSTGREDEDLGAVNFPETLKGDARANAILKAVTKAKRRVTLSICGLGFLDETEVEDIPRRPPMAPNVIQIDKPESPHDPETGEIKYTKPQEISLTEVDGKPDWITFGQAMIKAVETEGNYYEWLGLNDKTMAQMKEEAPKIHKRMMAAIDRIGNPSETA